MLKYVVTSRRREQETPELFLFNHYFKMEDSHMKRKLTAILLAASMVFCLALTGCSNPAPGGSDSGDAAPNGAASANYKAAKDSYKIGFVSWSIGHTVPAAWDEGIHTALDGFPQYEYTAFDGEASAETQIRIMSDLISQ